MFKEEAMVAVISESGRKHKNKIKVYTVFSEKVFSATQTPIFFRIGKPRY